LKNLLVVNSITIGCTVLLPLAYVAHLCEEWWGGPGFSAWTHAVLGAEVSPERFILINAVALPVFAIGTVYATRSNRFAWFAAALAALLVLNGALHLLATVGFATYSPGTITGVLLYLPLGGLVLRHMSRKLSGQVFARAVLAGIVAHALIAVAAFA
jgi:hypothetical protein